MSLAVAVELEALSHRYGDRLALDAVSLQVAPASVFSLLGPNGSGKSTLFRILATLMAPSSGTARVAGLDVRAQRDQVRRRIGVAFQHPSLDAKLTVFENLRHQGHLYGLSGRALRERIRELLDRFALTDRAGDRTETLSGGLKRRVELAKALLHAPQILILDEPSTGLDPAARASLMDHLHQLRDQDGVTTLLTTHLMDEADRCDRIGVLDEGRLVALDGPAELKRTIGG
ncbi:MAG: ABC transporter ATP-binding protein, partial [Planctomycetes bacterium]|nr:ABC transporter ATP-binding protein [Planctomycetota bacterium]